MPYNLRLVVKGLSEEWLQQPDRYARRSRPADFSDPDSSPSSLDRRLVFGVIGGLEILGKWGEKSGVHVPLHCCSVEETVYEAVVTSMEDLPLEVGKVELRLLILEKSPKTMKMSLPVESSSTYPAGSHASPVEEGTGKSVPYPSGLYADSCGAQNATKLGTPWCYRRVAVECGSTFPRIGVLTQKTNVGCPTSSSKEPGEEHRKKDSSPSVPTQMQTTSKYVECEVVLDLRTVGPPDIRFAKIVDFFPSLDVLSHPTAFASPVLALHFYSHNPRFAHSLYERRMGEDSGEEFSDTTCEVSECTTSPIFELCDLRKIEAYGISWDGVLPKPLPRKAHGDPFLLTCSSPSAPSYVPHSPMKVTSDDLWCLKELRKAHAVKDKGLNPSATQDFWMAAINLGHMENHVLEVSLRVRLKNAVREASALPLSSSSDGKRNTSSPLQQGEGKGGTGAPLPPCRHAYGTTMLTTSLFHQGTQGIIDIPVLCTEESETEKDKVKVWVVMHIQYTLHYPLMHRHNNFRLLRSDESIKAATSTKPVGHRGLGKTFTQAQLGRMSASRKLAENSVEAFVAADQRGCEMVEFDVMLTHDGIPIVFHDPMVELLAVAEASEGSRDCPNLVPISVPVHQLTGRQLQWVVKQSKHRRNATGTKLKDLFVRYWSDIVGIGKGMMPARKPPIQGTGAEVGTMMTESGRVQERYQILPSHLEKEEKGEVEGLQLSVSSAPDTSPTQLHASLSPRKHRQGEGKRFSSLMMNRVDITHSVPELKELFFNTPTRLRFNIEVKYPFQPVRDENIFLQKDIFEINRFVDSILNVVLEYGGEERHIAFSSFEPEICVALAMKQSRYDVFFLSGSSEDLKDYRSYYVEGAIQFASAHHLSGISILSSFLKSNHKGSDQSREVGKCIVDAAHRRQLKVWTWGETNSDFHFFQQQIEEMAVDAVITDNVVRR